MKGRTGQHRRGFTTVELIVVVAITMVLAGSLAFAASGWVRKMQWKQEEETARTLYTAAQAQLAEFKRNGKLAEWQEIFYSERISGTEGVTLIADASGLRVPLKNSDQAGADGYGSDGSLTLAGIWPNASGKDQRGCIVGVVLTGNDYESYLAGTADEVKTAVYDLIVPSLSDPSICQNRICLEFSPEAGQIFSAFSASYSESLTYAENAANGGVSLRDRGESTRKSQLLGYYGAETLSLAAGEGETPVITDLSLNNEETLNLTFTVNFASAEELAYDITVSDQESGDPLFLLKLNAEGTELKSESFAEAVSCSVWLPAEDGGWMAVMDGEEQLEVPVLAWISGGDLVTVILDAADLTASTTSYYDGDEAFLQTMSLHRFEQLTQTKDVFGGVSGTAAGDIFCSVRAGASERYASYASSAEVKSNSENAYFAEVSQSEDEAGNSLTTCEIANARHLYNIRYLEDASGTRAEAAGRYWGSYLGQIYEGIRFEVTASFSWSKFVAGDAGHTLYAGSERVGEAAFPSIKQLRAGDEFCGSDENIVISDLSVSAEENEAHGALPGIYVASAAEEAVSAVYQCRQDRSAALFLVNYGTMHDLTLEHVTVTGGKNTAAFCAVEAGTPVSADSAVLSDLAVTSDEAESAVAGTENVGGIAGSRVLTESDSADRVRYRNLSNAAHITGEGGEASAGEELQVLSCTGNVGGIVGLIRAEKTGGEISLSDCVNTGIVEAAEGTGENVAAIGGVAGMCVVRRENDAGEEITDAAITLIDCCSSQAMTKSELSEILSSQKELAACCLGTYVGGIVGLSDGAVLSGCRISEPESGVNVLFGGSFVGGLVGRNSGIIAAKTSDGAVKKTENIRVRVTVIGDNFVGGLVGYNDPAARLSCYTMSGGDITARGSFAGGAVGFNASAAYLEQDGEITVSPDSVTAEWCAGGAIGGNILSAGKNLTATIRISNQAAKVSADQALAGGMIGYNCLTDLGGEGSLAKTRIFQMAEECLEVFGTGQEESGRAVGSLSELFASRELLAFESELTVSQVSLTVTGISRAKSVTAGIFAGGVMGYNSSQTALVIRDVENETQVTADSAVSNRYEENSEARYSYVGGIIGLVTERMQLTGCSSLCPEGTGTYLGGLCEVNRGTIKDCEVRKVSSGKASAAGGLAGVNALGAVIEACSWEIDSSGKAASVSGTAAAGGFAAENSGVIEDCTALGNVKADQIAGGIAAVCAGSLITEAEFVACENHGTVSAETAGGILGCAEGDGEVQICDCVNTGLIGKEKKEASNGGIAGRISSGSVEINSCRNYGYGPDGSAQMSGILGTFSEGSAAIRKCFGIAAVSAPITAAEGVTVKDTYYLTETGETGTGFGIPAFVFEASGTGYELRLADGRGLGEEGFPVHPLEAFADEEDRAGKVLIPGEPAESNVRYQVFAADDTFFTTELRGEEESSGESAEETTESMEESTEENTEESTGGNTEESMEESTEESTAESTEEGTEDFGESAGTEVQETAGESSGEESGESP